MKLRDAWGLSLQSLTSHKTRSLLTVFGISVGIVAVVLLTALGEGARNYVRAEFDSLGNDFVVVVPGRTETDGAAFNPLTGNTVRDLTLEDARAVLRRASFVDEVVPAIIATSPARVGTFSRDVAIFGTTYGVADLHNLKAVSGTFLPRDFDSAEHVCVIGVNIRNDLFPHENPLGKILRLGDWRLRIVGVVRADGNTMGLELDDIVYLPVRTGMKIFNLTGIIRLVLKARSYESLPAATRQARQILLDRHDNEEDFTIMEPSALQDSFLKILDTLSLFLIAVAGISLAVAGLGVMNLMLVTVSERRGEIGLMKAIGARTKHVIRIFIVEALMLSVLGGIAGLTIGGIAVSIIRYNFPSFPLEVPPWAVVAALLMSGLTGLVFGTWPAYKASKIDPVQALNS